ncbi:MAG TPA: hypothetical protein VMX94_10130 [Armatimonadota bacterium]|nr:hypothetical protein [Armatimonadota bacterium]
MKETRRLDILALIGGVLALVAIAVQGYYTIWARTYSFEAQAAETREAILQRMPDTDVRADFEVLSLGFGSVHGGAAAQRALERAVKKFPKSARLNFRLGTIGESRQSPGALRRAAELDTSNALPLYLLASEAASRGAADEAIVLLIRGNRRRHVDSYPLPYEVCENNGLFEAMVGAANSLRSSPIHLRRVATCVSKHAAELHAAGHTDQALTTLGETKRMAWSLMRSKDATMMDLLAGTAIVAIADKREAQIYTETGSKVGLAQVQKEKRKLTYLSAGCRAYWDQSMEGLVRSGARFSAPIVSVAPIIGQSWLTVAMLLLWAAFALRTRRVPTSELHLEAAAKSFSVGRLLKYYAPIFLLPGLAASALTYLAFSKYTLVTVAAGAAFLVPSILLLWLSVRLHKKTYLQTAESLGREKPRFWAGAPAQDKREIARRLAGVHGGAMILLLVWGLLVSGVVKLTWDAFPWQIERAFAGVYKAELRYAADLVAGKVKVPQKYIREIEEREKQPAKPGGS